MGEDAEELFAQIIFGDLVVVIQPGLGPPADVERGVDMSFGPFHDLAELIPVVHVGEIQILHRCSGDDHAVILLILDLMEGRIKGRQVLGVSILGNVAQGVEQFYLDLERRVGELAQQLGLGDDLSGHQIQDKQVQRADVLMDGAVFSHDKDVLSLQNGPGGQRVGDSDRHRKAPFYYSSRDKIRVSQGVSLCKKELDR